MPVSGTRSECAEPFCARMVCRRAPCGEQLSPRTRSTTEALDRILPVWGRGELEAKLLTSEPVPSNISLRVGDRVARFLEGHDPGRECLHHLPILIQCLNIESDNSAITIWIGNHIANLDPKS
jgi:hypothetical protein